MVDLSDNYFKPVKAPAPKLVWLDLETTGLDPGEGKILEIGVVVTDLDLRELGRKNWILQYPRATILALMDDYVLNMHLSSGLLKAVWADKQADPDILRHKRNRTFGEISSWIRQTCKHERVKNCYLSGSSVGVFDVRWLRAHAPAILDTVSYRVGDVSTFKVFFPGMLSQPAGGPAHRALDDLDYSIDQLRQMRALLGLEGEGL